VTLIELVITMALLGLIASVTTLAIRRIDEPPVDEPSRMLADSLRWTVAESRQVTIQLVVGGRRALATINPDGSVVADSSANVERLSGVTRAR
jgi:hypothetical protein